MRAAMCRGKLHKAAPIKSSVRAREKKEKKVLKPGTNHENLPEPQNLYKLSPCTHKKRKHEENMQENKYYTQNILHAKHRKLMSV